MKINLFSERNQKSEYLSADLKANTDCRNIYFKSMEAALAEKENGDEVSFFLIKEDEKENLTDAVKLAELCEDADDISIKIYVFSTSDIAATVIDSIQCRQAELILIDPVETAVWNLMLSHPFYETVDKLHTDEICVAVIGKGPAIPTIIKTVYWCGRTRLFRMKMNMIGNDMAKVETELKLRSPGLFTQTMQENLPMKERGLITPELFLPLRLTRAHYHQADTSTEELEIALNECLNSNYIIIDEGDDEETLRTALMVRSHFIRKHILHENYLTGGKVDVVRCPDIYVYIRNEAMSRLVPNLRVDGHTSDDGTDELDLVPFGSVKDTFCKEKMVDTKLEKLARTLFHYEFSQYPQPAGSTDDGSADLPDADSTEASGCTQMPVSIKRRYLASALHLFYKMRDMNLVEKRENDPLYNAENFPKIHDISGVKIEEVESEFKYEITALEHQVWILLKLCDGWIPADAYHALKYGKLYEDGHRDHRCFAGKMSAACVESSVISGTGTKFYGDPSHFSERNRQTVMRTYSTIKKVYPDIKFVALADDPEF